ncbi:MAG: ATP-grasp domain-containing protein [Polyangiales bacterium]
MITVSVTAAGSAPALAFIRGLRTQTELAVRIVGVDGVAHSFGLFDCDARYTVPRVKDPSFIHAIHAICLAEKVDVLAPILDFELETFATAAASLRDQCGTRVITNSLSTIALACDKRESASTVARAGVSVPIFYDAEEALERAPLPLIVKPLVGAGSNGVTIVRSREELPRARAAAGPSPLVQQFIEGDEYTVDLVVSPTGRVLAVAPRIRVEVRAGQSYKGRTVDDDAVSDAARRCAEALGMTGQGNVQLIKSKSDGRCYFIEVNPKFAAAMGLTIGAGLNVPLLYVKLALGLPVRDAECGRRPNVWMLRAWQERYVTQADVDSVPTWTQAVPIKTSGDAGV